MDDKAVYFFDFLTDNIDTPEGKAMYILSVICVLMIVDFLTGYIAAWRNPNIKHNSDTGINGILRKLASIMVLVCCIPLVPLIPCDMGVAALIVLYTGYLLLEAESIIENLQKLGINITPITKFIEKFDRDDDKK